MVSGSEENLTCPVCQDIFKDPVLLLCSHSFCKDCVETWWKGKKTHECPVCKSDSGRNNPPRNLALKNLSEAFLLERDRRSSLESEALCTEHSERLKLFCLDHQQPVCLICRGSNTHADHRFRPIDEAARVHREELEKSLKPLQEKLDIFKQVKERCGNTAKQMKVQAQHTETQIRKQFRKLHQFLQEEEEARITALREEEKQMNQMMKEKIEALSREISGLSETIRATEEELRAGDVSFLQNYKAAVERVQQRPLMDAPEVDSGALIDVAKHLGNLAFNVWNGMKEVVSYSPVILDPRTVGLGLKLSKDLTSVRRVQMQNLNNPAELVSFPSVMGYEGFDSGTHSWDVEVGNSLNWLVGVVVKSFQWKGQELTAGLWALGFGRGEYLIFCPPEEFFSLPVENVQKIRVHLDLKGGTVTFSDPDTNTQIYTFTHTFTEKLFPYFTTRSGLPLKILPAVSDGNVNNV